jgi:hypothetical protein
MGLDFLEVQDFLEDKGISEMSYELVIDYSKKPTY